MKKTLILLLCGLLAVTSALAQGPRRPDTPLPKWEGLAQTPQMGWNSWNKFATNINEELIKATADKMVELGLVDAGYVYLNLDDGWHGERDEQGFIHEDPEKFPSGIKALADYMHEHGLKLGIYSDAGTNTCACYAGSLGHEYQDAFTYASWGIDYLKYDWCYTQNLNPKGAYITMRSALKKAGRPILFSICEWGSNKPWEWAAEVGHSWRTTGDIGVHFTPVPVTYDENGRPRWRPQSVLEILDQNEPLRAYAGPGHWNDAEMLEVGNGELTWDESVTHFSMWCMLAAPLMSGNDLREMDYKTIRILTNKEVIAVNQDPLGRQGIRFMDMGDREIWAKPLADGEIAVCFLNRGRDTWKLDYNWRDQTMYFARDVNFRKWDYSVRDLWAHKEIGNTKDRLKAEIPAHGVLMVRLKRN